MTRVLLNLDNFWQRDVLMNAFKGHSNEYEYTPDGIFRKIIPPPCPLCGSQMSHNGYNIYGKEGLGHIRIGRYLCSPCRCNCEEERDFWEGMKDGFFSCMNGLYQHLRFHHVSYEGISDVMDFVFPRGKDAVYRAFNSSVESAELPPVNGIRIVCYDEQHPKKGRTQEYRLTLLDYITGRPIADELHGDKNSTTILRFLNEHLNPDKPIFVVADFANGYPSMFEKFSKNVILQLCLLHLNKLIVKDFPKRTTMEQELTKYRLLSIFYIRDDEIRFLERAVEKERVMKQKGRREYLRWLKREKRSFRRFLHDLELKRRRERQNLEQRSYEGASEVFDDLMDDFYTFSTPVRKRLKMIETNWRYLTAFYFVDGAPATNNMIENYYSTSLKTHRKKQLRSDGGMANQLKLSAMRRAGMLKKPERTLLEVFLDFFPFSDPGWLFSLCPRSCRKEP